MRRTLIMASIFIGISAAHAQTVQPNQPPSQAVVHSDPLNLPTASLPLVSPSLSAHPTGTGRNTPNGAKSAPGAMSAAPSTNPETPLQMPGEKPDDSSQAASTTAAAPGPPSPICPPPVPSSDGGSVNLSEIAGALLGGC